MVKPAAVAALMEQTKFAHWSRYWACANRIWHAQRPNQLSHRLRP